MDTYDFYFAVMDGDEIYSVECVRLYGPSHKYLDACRPQYEKEGFTIRPATREEYRAKNWRKVA